MGDDRLARLLMWLMPRDACLGGHVERFSGSRNAAMSCRASPARQIHFEHPRSARETASRCPIETPLKDAECQWLIIERGCVPRACEMTSGHPADAACGLFVHDDGTSGDSRGQETWKTLEEQRR